MPWGVIPAYCGLSHRLSGGAGGGGEGSHPEVWGAPPGRTARQSAAESDRADDGPPHHPTHLPIARRPEGEVQEMVELYMSKGFEEQDAKGTCSSRGPWRERQHALAQHMPLGRA